MFQPCQASHRKGILEQLARHLRKHSKTDGSQGDRFKATMDYWKAEARESEITTEQAQKWVPHGCRVWRSQLQGRWMVQMYGKVRSASWKLRGTEVSCLVILSRWAWDLYHTAHPDEAKRTSTKKQKAEKKDKSERPSKKAKISQAAMPTEPKVTTPAAASASSSAASSTASSSTCPAPKTTPTAKSVPQTAAPAPAVPKVSVPKSAAQPSGPLAFDFDDDQQPLLAFGQAAAAKAKAAKQGARAAAKATAKATAKAEKAAAKVPKAKAKAKQKGRPARQSSGSDSSSSSDSSESEKK